MTISTTTRTKQYNGDNSTTVFAYDFNIQADSEIEVYLGTPVGAPTSWALQTITTNYSVSGAGTAGGGNITFVTAPPSGTGNVFIRRVTAKTQTSDYVENDPFSADTVEGNLDKLTQITQDMQEEIDRCFKLGTIVPDAGVTEASSVVADRANMLFAFDADGDFSVTQEIGTYQGDWAASTAYVARDLVKDTSNNNIYICLTSHTSSGSQPISSNTDVAKWALIVDAASATTASSSASSSATAAASSASAASASQTASAASAAAAATSESNAASSATSSASSATSSASSASSASSSAAEATGAVGAVAWKYTFDNSTTMADPGVGEIRFDNGTLGSITNVAIDAQSADTGNPDVSDLIASIDDGTNSTHEGYVFVRKSGSPDVFIALNVTGAIVDNTGWLQIPCTTAASGGSISNGDTLYISFSRSGNVGATGATGPQGIQGVQGVQGSTGVSAGLPFRFNSATSDSDKDAGDFWYNAAVGSATIVYLDDADSDGNAVSAITDTWDDNGSATHRGLLFVKQDADPSNMASFKVTGSITDASGYSKVSVTLLGAYGTISDNDLCHLEFVATGTGGIANRTVDTMTGDGSDTTLSLSQSPGSENNVTVTFDGVTQHHDTYSLSGSTITFSTAPPSGVQVEAVAGGLESIGTPSDGTVSGAKIAMGSDAQGDVLYHNGSQYTRLAKGTAGQALVMNSGATAPEWGSAGGPSLGTDAIIRTNAKVIDEDITFLGSENGMSAGPLTINSGRTVVVTSGSTWTVVGA